MIHEYIIKVDDEKKDIMGNMPLQEKPKELIRCKDCKHQDPDRFDDGEGNYVCRKGHGWKPDNWYCADGENRTKGGFRAVLERKQNGRKSQSTGAAP